MNAVQIANTKALIIALLADRGALSGQAVSMLNSLGALLYATTGEFYVNGEWLKGNGNG